MVKELGHFLHDIKGKNIGEINKAHMETHLPVPLSGEIHVRFSSLPSSVCCEKYMLNIERIQHLKLPRAGRMSFPQALVHIVTCLGHGILSFKNLIPILFSLRF